METFSALPALCVGNSPVPGEFPAQRSVTRSFDVSFDLRLNKRLRKQSWGWWLDTTIALIMTSSLWFYALQWRHNGHDSVSNHQPHDCLLNRLFRRRSKKTSKLRVTGLCAGNSPGTGEFPAQMASNAENVSIWWRHHGNTQNTYVGLRERSVWAQPVGSSNPRGAQWQNKSVQSSQWSLLLIGLHP